MDRRASTVIGSFREDLYRRHERAFLYTALMALLLSLALAAFRGWWTFLVLMGLAVAGLLYTAPLFPVMGTFAVFAISRDRKYLHGPCLGTCDRCYSLLWVHRSLR